MTKHLMLDYIREQPEAVANTLSACEGPVNELRDRMARRPPKNIIFAGLGSSHTAAKLASPLLRHFLPVPTTITVATEVGLDLGLELGPDTLVVLTSRSGERGGIVDALTAARNAGATCVAVTAVGSSLLATGCDLVIQTAEGPEAAYAKTKSVGACTAALMQIGLALSTDSTGERQRVSAALAEMPALLKLGVTGAERDLEPLAGWLAKHTAALVTGTAGNQGVAEEAALKIQEAARIMTEWDETGSALHGAISILASGWLYVNLMTAADHTLSRSLLQLVREFGADRLCVAEQDLPAEDCAEAVIRVPRAPDPLVAPLLFLAPVHLMTYHCAVEHGLNPDQPLLADLMLKAMLPPGREEPDWHTAEVPAKAGAEA
jgi:glucosamine--fructose-6-phosphate aminotransferase (isomerizing)